ncbi:hypothetical protein O9K51_01762 [Purpureocillium lavendulum]|uniref:Uncharacterized protein n=1 Tax=Purpureocillium lavendulum TaxID=1247861 RepID=A0AB34G8A7_9HYPO|nr:hypothetical protein O9K51_01762 [Purpureocillium lavendulum]
MKTSIHHLTDGQAQRGSIRAPRRDSVGGEAISGSSYGHVTCPVPRPTDGSTGALPTTTIDGGLLLSLLDGRRGTVKAEVDDDDNNDNDNSLPHGEPVIAPPPMRWMIRPSTWVPGQLAGLSLAAVGDW